MILKTQPKPTQLSLLNPLTLQRLSTWFGIASFSLRVWLGVWVLPSGHIYHDHLLKYARTALGRSLQDHFYRQNTRVPINDIIMHSQALQENLFSEVRFRVCQIFLKAVSLLAFHFPEKWAVKRCYALYKQYYSIFLRHGAFCTLLKRKMLYLKEVQTQ